MLVNVYQSYYVWSSEGDCEVLNGSVDREPSSGVLITRFKIIHSPAVYSSRWCWIYLVILYYIYPVYVGYLGRDPCTPLLSCLITGGRVGLAELHPPSLYWSQHPRILLTVTWAPPHPPPPALPHSRPRLVYHMLMTFPFPSLNSYLPSMTVLPRDREFFSNYLALLTEFLYSSLFYNCRTSILTPYPPPHISRQSDITFSFHLTNTT